VGLGFPEAKHGLRDGRPSAAPPAPAWRSEPYLALSGREVQVLQHVAMGMPNKQVAHQLGISESTVRNHLSQIFKKLHAANRVEAVVAALRVGLFVY
jgi:DNA-binding NarL/FixJ family response regulator